jgi:hypothetical protein
MKFLAAYKRVVENCNNRFSIIIGRDAVDGQAPAFHTFMDEHQLAPPFTLILVPALFHGQPYGFHWSFARAQTITRYVQIEMTRPQAVWTVIAVIDCRKQMCTGNNGMAMSALEIFEGGGTVAHNSSFRCK